MTVKITLEGMDQEGTKKFHCSFLTHEREKGQKLKIRRKNRRKRYSFPLPSRLTEGEVEPYPFPCVLQSRNEIQTEELEHP